MRYLKEEYWNNFKRDGRLFEDLVGELLKLEYPDTNFSHIGGPYDGGKDFLTQLSMLADAKEDVWVECKYHTSTLSFRDISMTLLMAYIENARQILVFSYAPLTSTFQVQCNRYTARTGVKVCVFADIALEQLILKHRAQISQFERFFPPQLQRVSTSEPPEDIACQYLFRSSHKIKNDTDRSDKNIRLNDLFYLEVHLFNPRDAAAPITLEVPRSPDYDHLNFLEWDHNGTKKIIQTCTVSAHSGILLLFPIRLRSYRRLVTFPPVTVYWDGRPHTYLIDRTVQCSWLAETPLLGNQYHAILQKHKIQLTREHFFTSVISGKSGLGKSRILKELEFLGLEQGVKVISLDMRHNRITADAFCKKLCAEMTGLPLFETKMAQILWADEACAFDLTYAARILYSDDFDIQKEWKRVGRYFAHLLSQERCLWLLDNAQDYDETIFNLLECILNYTKCEKICSGIIFSFNRDYIYEGTRADDFWHELRFLAGQDTDGSRTYDELTGFTPDDARQFVRECLSASPDNCPFQMDNLAYEQSIDKIVAHWGESPFLLQAYLIYLEQEGVLKRSITTSFYIHDAERFQTLLEEIPPDITALMHKRESLLLEHLADNAPMKRKYQDLICLIILTRCLPEVLAGRIVESPHLIEYLESLGLIARAENGDILFYHSYVERYYTERYPVTCISHEFLKEFTLAVDSLSLRSLLFFPYFWGQYLLGTVDTDLFQAALQRLDSRNIESDFTLPCMEAISLLLESGRFDISRQAYLDAYVCIIEMIGNRKGLSKRFAFFQRVYDSFMAAPQTYWTCMPQLFRIFRKYLISLLNTRQIAESLEINFILYGLVQEAVFDETEKRKILVKLYNCQVMVYNQTNDLAKALDANKKSMDILRGLNDPSELINTWRGRGDIYYSNALAYQYRPQLSACWQKALELYQTTHNIANDSGFGEQLKVATYLKAVLAGMIMGNVKAVEALIPFVSACIERTGMLYYEINARLVKAEYLIWLYNGRLAVDQKPYPEVRKLLDQATDLAALYGRQSASVHCFHLRALLQMCAGQFKFACDNYLKTAYMLAGMLKTESEYQHWAYFWMDFAIQTRKMRWNVPQSLFWQVKDKHLYSELSRLFNMSEGDFYIYYETKYQALSPLSDLTGKLTFPRI